jgi:hypothetical protein
MRPRLSTILLLCLAFLLPASGCEDKGARSGSSQFEKSGGKRKGKRSRSARRARWKKKRNRAAKRKRNKKKRGWARNWNN